MKRTVLFGFLVTALILGAVIIAHADTAGEHYLIPTSVLSSGSAGMTSVHYQTSITLAQATPCLENAEPLHSSSYDLYPGYWYTLQTNPTAMPWLILLLGEM